VNIIEIKIVGAVTDENTLEEIEDIAKVFAYERHMKDYTSLFHKQRHKIKICHDKNLKDNNRLIQPTLVHTLVKGLC
jgi:hypothetical protein